MTRSFVREHGLVAGAVALFALVAVAALPQEIVQDTWLTLVAGREVVQHGLPHHDALFAWTHGRRWVDQQWLAQAFFYDVERLGGLRLVAAVHVALVVGAAAVVAGSARRRSSAAAAFVLAFPGLLVAPWALQARAQSIAELLFAVCLALLVGERLDVRRLVALGVVLVLWANVHGTVVVGAALVVLRGLTLVRSRPRIAGVLVVGAPLTVFASPYGFALAGYYRTMLANPLLPRFLDEWRRSTPSVATAPFYVALALAVWMVVRQRARLRTFDLLALALLAAAAVASIRSIVWFALAAVVLLAPAADGMFAWVRVLADRRAALGGVALAAVAVLAACVSLARPTDRLLAGWPQRAADAAALAAGSSGRVYSAEREADWLLWTHPELRGRIAYDIRFELFRPGDFGRVLAGRRRTPSGYAVAVGAPSGRRGRVLYRDAYVRVTRSAA
jgi:hypothetical protein